MANRTKLGDSKAKRDAVELTDDRLDAVSAGGGTEANHYTIELKNGSTPPPPRLKA